MLALLQLCWGFVWLLELSDEPRLGVNGSLLFPDTVLTKICIVSSESEAAEDMLEMLEERAMVAVVAVVVVVVVEVVVVGVVGVTVARAIMSAGEW